MYLVVLGALTALRPFLQEYPVASSVRFTFDLLDGGPGGSGVTQTLCMLQLEEGNSTQQTGEEPNFDGVGTRTSTVRICHPCLLSFLCEVFWELRQRAAAPEVPPAFRLLLRNRRSRPLETRSFWPRLSTWWARGRLPSASGLPVRSRWFTANCMPGGSSFSSCPLTELVTKGSSPIHTRSR